MEIDPYYPLPLTHFTLPAKRRDTALIVIALIVVVLHMVGIALSSMTFSTPAKKVNRQAVVVKTVQLNQKMEPTSKPVERVAESKPLPTPLPTPIPIIEPAVVPEPEPTPVPVVEKVAVIETPPPVQVKEQPPKPIEKVAPKPTPAPAPVKKVETKKATTTPAPPKATKVEAQKTTPAKKPVTPAPVKKAETPPKPKPPEVDKKALEVEKAKQQAVAAAEKAKQQAITAAEDTARKKQQQLLSKAQESLAKMGEMRDKVSLNSVVSLADTSIPQRIQNLQIDALPAMGGVALSSQEIKYQDTLGARLKNDLTLPDYGTVKVKLTLSKTGKVARIDVTSKSEKNKKYIEKILPTLIFAPFGSQFDGADEYTFMLTLYN